MTNTPRQQHLAEQRERHGWYRRFILREPSIYEYKASVWTPEINSNETMNLSDPHHDREIQLRDLADELLDEVDDDGRTCREALEMFIAVTGAHDLYDAFLAEHCTPLSNRLPSRSAIDLDDRPDNATMKRLRDAMHAIYFADLLAGANIR